MTSKIHVPCYRENPFGDLKILTHVLEMPVIQSLNSNVENLQVKLLYIYIKEKGHRCIGEWVEYRRKA